MCFALLKSNFCWISDKYRSFRSNSYFDPLDGLQSKKECGKCGAVMGIPLVECRLGSSLHYSSIQAKYPKNLQRTIWEVNVPDTSSSSHGTAKDEVGHYHNRAAGPSI